MGDSDHVAGMELRRAFPSYLETMANTAIAALPPTRHAPSHGFAVTVAGEEVVIPYRFYAPEATSTTASLSTAEALITDCLYSRHHDGFVRQRHLVNLLVVNDEWVAPFVLQLLGEYVLEIVNLLNTNLATLLGEQYARFVAINPQFIERTKCRIVSYWNCYYRQEYPRFSDYPGFQIAESLGWWNPHDACRIRSR